METKEIKFHETMMRRCLDLASAAGSHAFPNPMVGAVLTCQGRIIGEGYHRQAGGPHAEVHAIQSVINKENLRDSTLYVNLEPCSHFGKTPPCADLIIRSAIPKVVIATTDPNPLVAGKGIERLREAGIEVMQGILAEEARFLNRRFFTFHQKNRPWVLLKWAQTLDGFIDTNRKADDQIPPPWITNPTAKNLVHRWRTEESAIMVGTHTIIRDNPQLTVREWTGKNPVRVVIDRKKSLPPDRKIFDGEAQTLVYTEMDPVSVNQIHWIKLNFNKEIIPQILSDLHHRNLISLMVEGGNKLLSNFFRLNAWDEARVFVGNKWFREGIQGPGLPVDVDYDPKNGIQNPLEKGNLRRDEWVGDSRLIRLFP